MLGKRDMPWGLGPGLDRCHQETREERDVEETAPQGGLDRPALPLCGVLGACEQFPLLQPLCQLNLPIKGLPTPPLGSAGVRTGTRRGATGWEQAAPRPSLLRVTH